LAGPDRSRDEDLANDDIEIACYLIGGDVLHVPTDAANAAIALAVRCEALEVAEDSVDLNPEPQSSVAEIQERDPVVAECHLNLGFHRETGAFKLSMQHSFPHDLVTRGYTIQNLPQSSGARPPAA